MCMNTNTKSDAKSGANSPDKIEHAGCIECQDFGCPMHGDKHTGGFVSELICHLPYAIFSVAFCLIILCFLSYFTFNYHVEPAVLKNSSSILFHGFHFIHILFSVTGSLITFYRFSKGIIKGMLVGAFSALIFCPLSDALMPYLAGRILGVKMVFHFCILHEYQNILPFVVAGIINGLALGMLDRSKLSAYSFGSHFLHILVSAFASMFYLVSFGMIHWHSQIGMIFIFLVIAVVIPCILSDIITPMTFARVDKRNERNKIKKRQEDV
ncbi:hypothetical protein ACFLYU_02825 [Candidatus Dependentiae bacterium]